jgi:paired amphipathic helix protein Sin3a
MENASVVNGLEYKISCKTYKVSYVLDTEDLFVRRVKRRSESDLALYERNRNQRRRIFGQWIDKSVTSVDDR